MATNGHATNGSATETDQSHVASFWARYEHLKMHDVLKNVLLEDVLMRYENLVLKHSTYTAEHESERERARHALQREQQALGSVSALQNILNRDPFVLVLVDGDGMVFNNNFLRAGEAGGTKVAAVLYGAVQQWAAANVVDCPGDVKVVVRVYANIKGLADVCTKAGIIASPTHLEEFARGFTRGKTLFDFVDAGYGKGRADEKVAETLKLFLNDYHCRQILFGCSHDNGYARLLEQYVESAEALQRITLLEGVPFEKELAVLPYPKMKFPSIFRDTKVSFTAPVDLLTDAVPYRPRIDSRGLNAACDVFTPGRSNTNTPLSSFAPGTLSPSNGLKARLSQESLPQHLRTFSSTSVSSEASNHGSWAVVAKNSAARPFTTNASTPATTTSATKEILRNRAGYRIDETLDYDRDEVQRLKKLKMCNQHYIGSGCCHYNAGKADKCPHRHEIKITAQERYFLRVVARETPCKKGVFCDDIKCIYGHRCPFPLATEGSLRGSGRCLNGDNCRFGPEMHGVDSKIVRATRVTGIF